MLSPRMKEEPSLDIMFKLPHTQFMQLRNIKQGVTEI